MTAPDQQQDANGNYLDSTGTPIKTPDGKPPTAGEQVTILNNGVEKKGHWESGNVVEDKEGGN